MKEVNYAPSKTGALFHASKARAKGVMGPIGSGKTTMCIMEAFFIMISQKPSPDGVRRSRGLIMRNTYSRLKTTCLESFVSAFPQDVKGKKGFGHLKKGSNPLIYEMRFAHPSGDGTFVEADVWFIACDRDDQMDQLLSLEITWAWLNEARELPPKLYRDVMKRLGRYPSIGQGGVVCSRYRLIMDTNPPKKHSWWYNLAEGINDPNKIWKERGNEGLLYQFWRQPGAYSPDAENLEWLEQQEGWENRSLEERRKHGLVYYDKVISDAEGNEEDINIHVHGMYGNIYDGQPVYPQFSRRVHVAKVKLKPIPGVPILVGVDCSGNHPAAVFAQRAYQGQWLVLGGIAQIADDGSMAQFSEWMAHELRIRFPDNDLAPHIMGDPAGWSRTGTGQTFAQVLDQALKGAAKMVPSPGYHVATRVETVKSLLTKTVNGGQPKLLVCPSFESFIAAMEGEYHYKHRKATQLADARMRETPFKDRASDICNAFEYMVCGAGEMKEAIRGSRKGRKGVVSYVKKERLILG